MHLYGLFPEWTSRCLLMVSENGKYCYVFVIIGKSVKLLTYLLTHKFFHISGTLEVLAWPLSMDVHRLNLSFDKAFVLLSNLLLLWQIALEWIVFEVSRRLEELKGKNRKIMIWIKFQLWVEKTYQWYHLYGLWACELFSRECKCYHACLNYGKK